MKIKNWKLYLESNDTDIDHVRDAFTNLSDEYEIIIIDKGYNLYTIHINTGFDLTINQSGKDFDLNMKEFNSYKEKLKKLERLNFLIEEAVSRFEGSKWRVLFGNSDGFDWGMLEDDLVAITDVYERTGKEFCPSEKYFVSISLNIKTEKYLDSDICIEKDNNLIVNGYELKKKMSDLGYTLDGEISLSRFYQNSIKISVKENLYNNQNPTPESKKLIRYLREIFGKFTFSGSGDGVFCRYDNNGGFVIISIHVKYKIILE
jgi:hypothetical protein